jgi:glyoxylase-like metal-dependent hydrolase (beta-lactamase superfamily II)
MSIIFKTLKLSCAFGLLGAMGVMSTAMAQNFDEVEINTQDLGNGVYVMFGYGGNIGLSVGEDGVIMVDDQYAPLTDKVLTALAEVTDEEVAFVLNTHFHFDHTGGNENLGRKGSIIIAHDHVYEKVSKEFNHKTLGRVLPAMAKEGLPKITFNDQMSFRINGDNARVFHVANAHTDGDSIIYFENADVLHMGDVYFNYLYPFIDVFAGGNVDGVLKAQAQVLAMVSDKTQITLVTGRWRQKMI